MGILKIKSAAKVAEEEALLTQAKKVCAKQPRTNDDTDYKTAQAAFKECALDIRTYINSTSAYNDLIKAYPALETFRASFDEVAILMEFLVRYDDRYLEKRLLKLQQLDTAMEYEASALAIEQPRAWYSVWEDELGPYEGNTSNSTTETAE